MRHARLALFTFFALAAVSVAVAQPGEQPQSPQPKTQPQPGAPAPQQGNTPRARRPRPGAPQAQGAQQPASAQPTPIQQTPGKTKEPGAAVAPERPRWLFPDWGAASFDWSAYPVLGFSYDNDSETKTKQTSIEAGVGARVTGIPLKEGNPGASITPDGGYAVGFVTLAQAGKQERTGVYHRIWTGLHMPVVVKFTKTTPGVRYAQVNGNLVEKRKMGALDFDEGILVLPFFAVHYTYEYTRLFEKSFGTPLLTSNDHWVSLRLFTAVLNASAAVGPGVTFTKFYLRTDPNSDQTELLADTRTDFVKLLARSDLVWKLRASLDSKYIVNVKRKEGGLTKTEGGVRLPDQALFDAPRLPLYPEDTLVTSAFVGIKGLLGGLGFGYRYTLEVFQLGSKNGAKQTKREKSGVGLFYEAAL